MANTDDEDDYMNMTFEEAPKQETSLQRRARIEREGKDRGYNKSKATLEAEAEAKREAALANALDSTNKGFKMMAKLGFKQGDALGKSGNARKEPIQLSMKDDRGGIGMDSEKKRKFREQMEKAKQETKKAKVEEGDYRERVRQDREEKKNERDFYNAQRTAERLHEQALDLATTNDPQNALASSNPLKDAHVVWRGLLLHRFEKMHDKKQQHELRNNLSARLPAVGDDEEDNDDKIALGCDVDIPFLEDYVDNEDPELEAFNELPFAERLRQAIAYLRERHHYCFWCKYQYPDASMEGCPGIAEEDHD
ncbi:hypothetical protein CC78DRAFT_485604 [Lojkania enalia]|uniref:G-patch domain-containing protein n=1 Tax=Lojkania enalia TaxID=147567 RepID=A0A9P4NCG8_9PLEO|nr:hypothetical protein CC78DRAFT_485604 [Didymosphaeria enalia]